MKTMMTAAACTVCLLAAGCEATPSSTTFHTSETMRTQQVAFGLVTNLRAVDIRPGQTRLGTATGAVLGGIAGSQIGSGTAANLAGGVAGAVAGGALGSALQGSRNTRGVEITLRLDSGGSVVVVQPGDPRDFRVGDRVRLIGDSENARVSR